MTSKRRRISTNVCLDEVLRRQAVFFITTRERRRPKSGRTQPNLPKHQAVFCDAPSNTRTRPGASFSLPPFPPPPRAPHLDPTHGMRARARARGRASSAPPPESAAAQAAIAAPGAGGTTAPAGSRSCGGAAPSPAGTRCDANRRRWQPDCARKVVRHVSWKVILDDPGKR